MTLTDQAARDRIRTETSSSLFVEAGAGSGKTRSLVERVTHLVLMDGVPLRRVAAVTFTEKAGAELRDRLRANFEEQRRSADDNSTPYERATEALEDLDSAAIGTLHSFAQRILTIYPIEAGLPPLVEVLDEVASSVAFEERWSVLQRELLEDDAVADRLLLALAAGIKLDHLRSLTRAFGADWDLIEECVLEHPPAVASLPDVTELAERAIRLAARARECSDADDKFLAHLEAFGEWGTTLGSSVDDRARYAALVAADALKLSYGKKANWLDLAGLKTACEDLRAEAKAAADAFTEATLRPLAHWIAEKVHRDAIARATEGRLEFHDLLVVARNLLRRDADVRDALQQRYPRLLLDEFQDTDPIQIELAVRIAGGRSADAERWQDVEVPPGSLFVVGDPKQSIYRFRRANIGLYLETRSWFGPDQVVDLTTNFRTVDPILTWVNHVFAEVIQPIEGGQPAYTSLVAHRDQTGTGPAVTVLGAAEWEEKTPADQLRILEADDVSAVIEQALTEGWTVFEEATASWRPLRLADVAILIPSRISLAALEHALDEADIPYRAESSSLVYQAQEVRDLLMATQVVADPSDQFSSVMALRSSLFGCGDDDLWSWKQAKGSFNPLAPTEAALERLGAEGHPVATGLDYLRRLHRRARWMTPSEVLGALVADRVMLEVAWDSPRPRDQWRRLRFVVDQARAWSEVELGGLRSYLQWATKQSGETARVAEAVLPETDVDAVRIMTVHGSKGLEFPMVVLSGMSSQPRNPSGVQLLWGEAAGGEPSYSVKLTKSVQTNDFKDAAPIDEQMDSYERRRLLYVAATRARDHLVVSLHRGPGTAKTNARLLAEAGAGDAPASELQINPDTAAVPRTPRSPVTPPPEWREWLARLEEVRARTRQVSARSASGLEGTDPEVALAYDQIEIAGLHKGGRDVELPPWKKGRYGSAIGRAVHGVLQVVDLATGAGLDETVAAQCLAEGVTEDAEHVRALVQNALLSDTVQRVAARPHWRESYVGMVQDDGTVLEGFVDLIYREDDGSLVVVDYKTDDIPREAVPTRATYYAPQLAAYQSVLRAATGDTTLTQLLFTAVRD